MVRKGCLIPTLGECSLYLQGSQAYIQQTKWKEIAAIVNYGYRYQEPHITLLVYVGPGCIKSRISTHF